jgi:hypothetical protein
MSTLKVNTIQHNTSGFNNVIAHTDGAGTANAVHCRAWVKFNGTGTIAINAQFNVSSITDNATGNYKLNFSNALADSDYSAVATITPGSSLNPLVATIKGDGSGTMSSTALDIGTWNQNSTTLSDTSIVCVSVFR